MLGRVRRSAWGVAAVTVIGLSACAARSPSLRASCSAAYRAFRDPSLLDPPPPAPPPVDCRRFSDDGRSASTELTHDFQPPDDSDLADPEGGTLSNLAMPELRVPVTRRTLRYVRFFAKSEPGRAAFLQRYRRAGLYRETIEAALREAGLPEDLVWLPAIESGFDARAVSPAGAAGLWQFMPDTGQLYGLDQSPWVDERRSIARATTAAAVHLRDLYERLHRWDLALAAYNAGYDRVAAGMAKIARERGPATIGDKPIGFSDLAAARALPAETMNYVPQVMAFAIVANNRARFGLDQAEAASPLELGEIAVPEGTRMRTIARAAGISVAVLRDHNPQILRDRVPPTGGDYLISVPAGRVAHAIATFPAYLEQEVVAQNEVEDESALAVRAPIVGDLDPTEEVDEDPLPRRPVYLGKNRLPTYGLPGEDRMVFGTAALAGIDVLGKKLPATLASVGIGWQRPYSDDPLGIFAGAASAKGGMSAALEKQLGFLNEQRAPIEALRSFTLPSGIVVRLRKDAGIAGATVTVRVATNDDSAPHRHGEGSAAEALYTLTVGKGDADAAIELAAGRVRLALGDAEQTELAEVRRAASEPRRRALKKAPYGSAWIALSGALFPPGHPLAGTVVGAAGDPAGARDLLLAEQMQREHARARASITVVGDIDEVRSRKLADAFLGSFSAAAESPIGPHPKEDRIAIEEAVADPHALYGWIGPGEGEAGDASMRIAVEILKHPKIGRLRRALVDSGICSLAEVDLEVGPRASVCAIEIAPAATHDLGEAERRLDAEIASLAGEGPTAEEVAVAKVFLKARLAKELGAQSPTALGMVHSAPISRLRHAILPGEAEKALGAIDDVSVGSVRTFVKRLLARDHRAVVITSPARRLDTPPPG